MRRILENLLIGWGLVVFGIAQTPPVQPSHAANTAPKRVLAKICVRCVRSHMDFLASDAMNGRGSATHDELVAATYVASQLHAYGVEPAGDDGGYLQRATVLRLQPAGPPKLVVSPSGEQPLDLAYGRDFLSVFLSQTHFEGELQKLDAENSTKQARRGAVVLIKGDGNAAQSAAFAAVTAGAAGALMLAPASRAKHFSETGARPPKMPVHLESSTDTAGNYNVLQLSKDAFAQLVSLPDGTAVKFDVPSKDEKAYTWNAVGILRGWDPALKHSAILLSAHLDHLGIGDPVNGDDIYNGADDDASGTTAVLELARTLGRRRPRRTVIFALFGSEELGGLGSTYFREHPPVPLADLAANLEFEMLGRPDPKLSADTLYLTGWERSNLGPVLAAHGARLVGDPHPEQNFFARSDNFVLAQKGVVAQTVSSYGLHTDYHRPSDDLAHIDFTHMDAAIGSLLGPVGWLVNSGFRPKWNEGGKPTGPD
jgi:aminopeptidase YwaD